MEKNETVLAIQSLCLKIIIKKYIKAISVFLKILFYSLPVASEIYIYIHQSLQGNGRKETVFG